MLLDSLFKKQGPKGLVGASLFDCSVPLFSQGGRNIYASDVIQTGIDCIASEVSKLVPRHISHDVNGKLIKLKGDNLNKLFRNRPNPLMTTRDFLEKITWSLFLNYNTFIYPSYVLKTASNGHVTRIYTGLWPLNPTNVDFLQDASGTLFIKFYFQNGYSPTVPYMDVIHLRKKYSLNDFMGGDRNGKPNNEAISRTLEINDTIIESIAKGIKTACGVKGILKLNTTLEDEKQKREREEFENKLQSSESGILVQDLKAEFAPINIDPKFIDKETLAFIENKIFRYIGVSLPILNGDYNDDQYQAFYNKSIEPIVVALNQGFTSICISEAAQDHGNEIVFYQQMLELMDIKNKLAILDGLGSRGALTNNQLLALFGMEPYEGGDVRMASLNYINAELMDEYQLARAHAGKNGGKEDEKD